MLFTSTQRLIIRIGRCIKKKRMPEVSVKKLPAKIDTLVEGRSCRLDNSLQQFRTNLLEPDFSSGNGIVSARDCTWILR